MKHENEQRGKKKKTNGGVVNSTNGACIKQSVRSDHLHRAALPKLCAMECVESKSDAGRWSHQEGQTQSDFLMKRATNLFSRSSSLTLAGCCIAFSPLAAAVASRRDNQRPAADERTQHALGIKTLKASPAPIKSDILMPMATGCKDTVLYSQWLLLEAADNKSCHQHQPGEAQSEEPADSTTHTYGPHRIITSAHYPARHEEQPVKCRAS